MQHCKQYFFSLTISKCTYLNMLLTPDKDQDRGQDRTDQSACQRGHPKVIVTDCNGQTHSLMGFGHYPEGWGVDDSRPGRTVSCGVIWIWTQFPKGLQTLIRCVRDQEKLLQRRNMGGHNIVICIVAIDTGWIETGETLKLCVTEDIGCKLCVWVLLFPVFLVTPP